MVAAARDQAGTLVGLAPFYRDKLRLLGVMPVNCLRVLGDSQSGAEYADMILRTGVQDAAAGAMLRTLTAAGGWDCIWLPNVASWTGSEVRISRACRAAGLKVHRRDRDFGSRDLPSTYDEVLQSLSSNMRSTLRRQGEKMLAADGCEIVFCERADQLPEMLEALFTLNHQRWQSVGQVGTFVRRTSMRKFYETFATEALDHGWLRLAGMKMGGRYVAVQFGYAYGGVFHQLQEGFEPAIAGAGNALRIAVVRRCIEEGLAAYDFLGGYSEHKRRWGAQERVGCDLFIGARSAIGRLLFQKQVWPTGRYLRQTWPANEGRH
jgi:hypothetical protein